MKGSAHGREEADGRTMRSSRPDDLGVTEYDPSGGGTSSQWISSYLRFTLTFPDP